MTSRQIRQQFLDFFASKGHAFVPSSPVVPHDDPTLMFTNAGMNQFKPIFLGTARAEHPRTANSQKCIRAGGKHNDLDDVGQDTYHHTFFEMMGNWSFGDYFKKEAIAWAWELLTKVWEIDKSRLHATYFRGDPAEGLEPDSEAAELWRTVTDIDPTHIHPGNKKDNFWEMGDTGPCGPCSEIHIDLTPDKSGRDLVNKGDARVMELWNLVFIQFNRGSDSKLTPLPAKHVDTGMGFERLCAILQKKTSNYDTDVFAPIFDAIQRRTGAAAYRGTLPHQNRDSHGAVEANHEATKPRSHEANRHEATKPRSHEATTPPPPPLAKGGPGGVAIDNRQSTILVDVSYRVIADHLRCLTFALTDGAIPSNEGRGYVLRRILRRAVRYGRQYMNMHEPFLCDLVPTVVEHMGNVFPELRSAHGGNNAQHVSDLIREEETSFLKTLGRGIDIFDGEVFHLLSSAIPRKEIDEVEIYDREKNVSSSKSLHAAPAHAGKWRRCKITIQDPESYNLAAIFDDVPSIPGNVAFVLHDTYGFPIDLTQIMAAERGLCVDIAEYERLMHQAREQSKGAPKKYHPLTASGPDFWTDDSFKYAHLEIDARLKCFATDDGFSRDGVVAPAQVGDECEIHLDRTCFYAEQGGQVGDRGTISSSDWTVEVLNTVKAGDSVAHCGRLIELLIDPWQPSESSSIVTARVARQHRLPTMQNHTATHILNWALREALGELVQQKGSLVDPEKTRFDFSHNKQLSEDELNRIEDHVRSQISNALPVLTSPDVDQKKAREINTLRAVFGEKYPDKVRVVSIGADIDAMLRDPKNPKWMKYSVEFCGGTHLKNSKEAEEFVLVSEEGVAKGVRRVVGVTAEQARKAVQRGEQFLEIAETLRTGRTPPLPPLMKGGGQGPSPQPSPLKGEGATGPRSGPYDLARLLKEIAEAQIPILTRHRLAGQIAVLQEAAKEQQKKSTAQAQRGAVEAVADLLASKAMDVGGVTVVVGEVPGGNADALRSGIDYVRNKKGSSGVLLATVDDCKVTLVAGMSKDLVERGIKAGDLIKEICPLVGGKGGGRPDMAQGGGNDPKGLAKALERAREWLNDKLS